ncbi:MAG: DUF2157 domain-containing protein [Leptospiraceae bacterium]|nr:DUF2157 domain-containing protein [Leptospiraceae bacterium]
MIWEKKLIEWQKANLIQADQAAAIAEFEQTRSAERPYILFAFVGLGIVAIMIGIISLIAFNWDEIPAAVKLATDFGVMVLLAIGLVYLWQKQSVIWFEATLLTFALWIPATIGLVSQVFHQGGELYDALLWSCSLSALLLVFTRKAILPHLWLAAFTFASAEGIFGRLFDDSEGLYFIAWLSGGFLLLATIMQSRPLRAHPLQRALAIWGLGILTGGLGMLSFDISDSIFEASGLAWSGSLFMGVLLVLSSQILAGWGKAQSITAGIVVFLAALLLSGLLADSEWLRAFTLIGVFLGLAAIHAGWQMEKIFHFYMIAAGIRIYAVYLEVFSDLATTGIGLIFSGLVFIAMGLAYWYGRKHLARMAAGLNQD